MKRVFSNIFFEKAIALYKKIYPKLQFMYKFIPKQNFVKKMTIKYEYIANLYCNLTTLKINKNFS